MLMCNKNCIYSDNGYCLLSAEEHLSGVADGCDSFKEKRKSFAKSENKVNSFSYGANVNKLNGRRDV
jgi:hypothetical protein